LFDGIGVADQNSMDLADEEYAPERFVGAYVTPNIFALIGQQPIQGRDFTDGDDRPEAAPTVILGHAIWQRWYQGDPGVVGRLVRVNGLPATVIGVMPEGFGFPVDAALWQPLAVRGGDLDQRGNRNLDAFGRLAAGVTIAQAEADLARVMDRLARESPATNEGVASLVRPFRERNTSGRIQIMFTAFMGAVVFLLLIACANVANLLLARGATRGREIAVRLSLGATRRQIVRQLLAESLLLAVVAGATGLTMAAFGVRVFQAAIAGTGEPYWLDFPMDARVFAFVGATCLGTAVLAGLAPARHTTRISLLDVLGEAGRTATGAVRARRLADVFVVLQIAMSLTLLAGAGLMIRTLVEFSRLDIGVDTDGLTRAEISLPGQRYPTVDDRRLFYRQLGERLAATPGIRAGIASAAPLGGGTLRTLSIEGRVPPADRERPTVLTIAISPGYLETLGLRAVRGRLFSEADQATAGGIALVNERFAEVHFPGSEPIGESIRLRSLSPAEADTGPVTIVGLVPNVRQVGPNGGNADPRSVDPLVYVPYAAGAPTFATIVARSEAGTAAAANFVRAAVGAVNPDLPVSGLMPLDESLAQEQSLLTTFSSMFGLFALAALGLAMIGLYAVTAFAAAQRNRELGIRLALGARARHVWWLVTRRAAIQLAVGVMVGLAGAVGVGQLLQGTLNVGRDPVVLVGVPVLLVLVALAACMGPARRAMRLDPVAALRAE
jgi:predicted permease